MVGVFGTLRFSEGVRTMRDREANRELWLGHVRAWRESGLTQRAYCETHGLKLSTLGYWSRRERGTVGGVKLVPVKVEGMSLPGLVLRGAQGWQLSLPPGIPSGWLAELLRAL